MGLIRLINQNKTLILLCFLIYLILWFSISTFKQSKSSNRIRKKTALTDYSNSSFSFILNSLLKLEITLLLIDPYVLNYLFIRQLPFDSLNRDIITFAISEESLEHFFKYDQQNQYSFQISRSLLLDGNTSIDHIFIEYQNRYIHLAVLHKYNTYFLIEKNILALPNYIQLSYGDKLRAVDSVETEYHEYSFLYPRNVSHFLWLYETSEFLHCNRALADEMENQFHLYQNQTQLNLTVLPMRNIVQGLNQLEKRYWLAGGTLLGWYRHCGSIPFTQDADFGLFAEEYDESIRNYFLGNSITYLWGALGLVNDSLEFRLYTGRYTFDLFWAYLEGDHRWCGYQVHRAKFRRTLPLLTTLCSCDLFGFRFTIPCSPTDYLNAEYGKNKWQMPLEKNYTWINMKFHSMWDDISWMYATRLYTREGKLRTDKFAIDWISKHFNYSITAIPSFLNVLPNYRVTLPPLKTKLVYGSQVKKRKVSMKRTKFFRK